MSASPLPHSASQTPKGVDFSALPRVVERAGVDAARLASEPALGAREPCVLRGLVRHWPEVDLDDGALLDSLAARASPQPLPFYTARPEADGRVFYDASMRGFNFERRRGQLADCCRWLRDHADDPDAGMLYVGSTAVDGWLPGFSASHALELGVDDALCSLWLGNRTRIAAHYDFPRNLACVVSGRRRFTLFPPEQMSNLYPGPLEHTPSGQPISMIDFHAVDEARFPRFGEALETALVAELEAGDAIYIPSMWWHHVEALASVNLLINYWWRDSELYLGSPQAALLHAALAIGQLTEAEREPWERLFQHTVFRRDDRDWEHLEPHQRGVMAKIDEAQARALRQQLSRQLQL